MASFYDLFRTKSVGQLKDTADRKGLRKALGAFDITLMGIGAIIGAGIFVLTGVAAAKYAGPGIVISFLISAVACVLVALIYAELASMVPVAGSTYTYTYASMGELVAWIVGWDLILEYFFAVCMVASGWSGYMVGIFRSAGIVLPGYLTAPPEAGGIVNLPAMAIPVLIGLLLARGTKESAAVNRAIVFVKLAVIFLFIVLAVPKIDPANWTPFLPYGFQGVMAGAAIIVTAFLGFDATSTTAEESRDPGRDIPVGIISSLLICTVLYTIVALLLTGLVPYTQLNNTEPVAFALAAVGYRLGSAIVAVGAIAGITTVLLVMMYGQTRIVFAMSRDGFLPEWVSRLHPKYGTPYIVTLVSAGAAALVAGLVSIQTLAELINIGTLFAFILAAVGVSILRYRLPGLKRPFKVPALYLVAPLAVVLCLTLMLMLPMATWIRFLLWFSFGLIIYFGYGYTHSALRKEKAGEPLDPK